MVFRTVESLARQRTIHPGGKRFRVDTRVGCRQTGAWQTSVWLQPPPQEAVDRSVALFVLTHQ
jgi:hypothetical protein